MANKYPLVHIIFQPYMQPAISVISEAIAAVQAPVQGSIFQCNIWAISVKNQDSKHR